jgi:hypothetical protein
MFEARIEAIDAFIETQLSDDSKGRNFDIYEPRLTKVPPEPGFEKVPHSIYFYYVRFDRDGGLRVDHYLWPSPDSSEWGGPIAYDEVPAILRTLAINARPRTRAADKNPPPLPSRNFQSIPWRHISYVAVLMDEANWRFHKRADGNAAIAFVPDRGTPNHSFFDARDVMVDMPIGNGEETDQRSAIYFVNHMKADQNGATIGDTSQVFKFNLNLNAAFAEGDGIGLPITIDPDGTNVGPPIGPP